MSTAQPQLGPANAARPLSSEKEIQAAYRDESVSADYVNERFVAELHRLLHDRQVQAVQRLINHLQPGCTLEIAPGPGRLTNDLKPSGKLVCLEYNAAMIAQGQRAGPRQVFWVRGNGFQLPFSQSFDLVYSFRFIRHFHREDRERLYGEIRRVLKPEGYFILDAVNARFSRPLREACPEQYPIYDKLYRPEQLREELASAGLNPLCLEPVQKHLTWQSQSQRLLGPRANWLNRLVIRGMEWLPRREGLEWIVTCCRV